MDKEGESAFNEFSDKVLKDFEKTLSTVSLGVKSSMRNHLSRTVLKNQESKSRISGPPTNLMRQSPSRS